MGHLMPNASNLEVDPLRFLLFLHYTYIHKREPFIFGPRGKMFL